MTQQSIEIMMSTRSISTDSRNTEAQLDKAEKHKEVHRITQRKMSLEDIQHNLSDNLYGRFDFQNYSLMRGFIDGRGKGVRLHYIKLEPFKKVASLCIFHGYGQHSSDYLEIASFYANNGIVVHMLDLRGFGLSGGNKQHDSLTELYCDIQTLLKCCQPTLPIYLFCHGFGSTLVMSLLTSNTHLPITGLIIVTPIFSFPKDCDSLGHKISSLICRTFLGDLLVNNHVNPTGITKNNFVVKKIIDQGCDFQYMKLRMIQELQVATDQMLANADKIQYPILMYSGAANIFQDIYPVEQYFSSISSRDKTFRCFSKGYHALHQDQQCDSIKKHSLEWIYERIGSTKNQIKIMPLKIPLRKIKRFSWKKVIGYFSAFLVMFRLFKMLLKRISFK